MRESKERRQRERKESKKVVEIVSGTLVYVLLSRAPPQTGKGLVASRVPRRRLSRMLCFCGFVVFCLFSVPVIQRFLFFDLSTGAGARK
jgi:hypothetical protein